MAEATFISLVIGAISGLLLGLTGAGGGVVAVPLLAVGLDLPLTEAAPLALLAVALTASGAALAGLRRGIVRYRAAFVIAAVGLLCAPLGLQAAALAPERYLWWVFAAVMLVVAARMARSAARDPVEYGALDIADPLCPRDPRTGRFIWRGRVGALMGAIGAGAGFLSGLLGVGGGFVIVPALRAVSDLDMHAAIATSLMAIALIALGTVAWALATGHAFEPLRVATYVGGTAAGTLAGRLAARRLPTPRLQQLFAASMVVVAVLLLFRNN